jgi:Lamin Tail Domain/Immunoglobulin I-set domain
MKTKLIALGTLLLLCLFAIGTHAAAFTTGNVIVTQVGDGSAALSAVAAPVFVLEYLPSTANQSSPVQTITIPATGASRLTGAGNASSEDYITRSTNATILTLGGYDADSGTAGIATTTATNVSRVVGQLDVNGNFTRVATGPTTMYNAANIRSAVSDGINYWTSGSSGGIWYSAGGATPTAIGGGNFRVARIFNGNLYYSASTTISAFSGLPTATATGTATGITGSSVYDFAINPAGNVAYVADDSGLSTVGGIAKWTFNGSIWSKKLTLTNGMTAGCRGLAVDFSGANPVLYATTADSATKLITITDTSAFGDTTDTADQVTVLATAPSLTAFRGVAIVPTTSPVMISQPSDVINALVGATINLTATATSAQPLGYQWYYTNSSKKLSDGSSGYGGTISGSTNATLTLTSVATAQTGGYQVVITNANGSITSRVAQVTIVTAPVPPTIDANITPIGSTNVVGDAVSFSVTAHGIPAVAFQWKMIPDTNNLVTNIISGATGATLPLANLNTNQSGKYFVTITNSTSYLTTNSAMAVLKVNPTPSVNIATLRGMVDPGTFAPTNTTSLFTVQGIVTTWVDMTGVANTEFYMQDASGGICVFWSGASGTANLPPAGALVQVTGTLAAFNGLLEIEAVSGNPLQSVTVISTNNPLPAAQPLPFDPNVTGYPATTKNATMNAMEGMYFVASNVMLNLSTPNFVSGANDAITNNNTHTRTFSDSFMTVNYTNGAGQTFILFVNAQSGLPGQPKYTGPVTIYGILGYFTSAGFELTPTRYADIISYNSQTNVVSNVVRPGDLLTNTYTENRLLTGETLTAHLSIGDPEGGTVTLSPGTGGLPANASWSGVTGGQTGKATFQFTPASGDAGSNYVVNLGVSSTSGNAFTNSFTVYVPAADEQQIAISEFLANPTTNSAAPNFNPLHRGSDTLGSATNDEYIEIANLSGTDMYLYGWGIYNGSGTMVENFSLSGPTLASSNAVVVYGGDSGETPNLPGSVYDENATSHALSLAASGGTIILRNQNGNIIDRVVYAAGALSTNGSLTRFPNLNGAFVPQPYVSANLNTPGLQYDGSPWNQHFKVPAGVPNVGIRVVNGQALFNFTANTSQASTLWGASTVAGPYQVITGRQFPVTVGAFTNPAPNALQFYYISTQ